MLALVLVAMAILAASCAVLLWVRRSGRSAPVRIGCLELLPPGTGDDAPFASMSLCDAFDQDTAALWETQRPAFNILCSAGGAGVDKRLLSPAYRSAAHSYPELYEGTTFDAWLGFLQESDLVICTAEQVKMTGFGMEFARCLEYGTLAHRSTRPTADPRHYPD